MDYETLILSLIVIMLIYFVTSIIIREIGELVMKLEENTFHKASKVAGMVSALLFVQFLVREIWIWREIILILTIVALFVMTHLVYKLDWKESGIMAFCCISVYAVILLIIAAVYFFLQPTWG